MNGTVEIHQQKSHGIWVRHDQFPGLELEVLVWNEIMSDQYKSLHLSGVLTWLVKIYCVTIFNQRHELYSAMCGGF